jgi:DNA-binding transcriptional MocR family regulator
MPIDFPMTPASHDGPILPGLERLLRPRWPFEPEAMTVVDGALDGLDVVTRAAIAPGSRVVVENPGIPPLLDMLESRGVTVVGVELDEEGMQLNSLRQAFAEPVAAVFLQPLGQNPTGVSMTNERAAELAKIIDGTDALVVEDAACSAISPRRDGLSLGSWLPEQTVYIQSLSKSHGPELRLAIIGGPTRVIDAVTALRRRVQGWTSRILQQLALTLLDDPASENMVDRAAGEYQVRRRSMVDHLAAQGIEVEGSEGYNLWLPVVNETAAVVSALKHGITVAPGSAFAVSPMAPHLRVTISTIVGEQTERLGDILSAIARESSWVRQ